MEKPEIASIIINLTGFALGLVVIVLLSGIIRGLNDIKKAIYHLTDLYVKGSHIKEDLLIKISDRQFVYSSTHNAIIILQDGKVIDQINLDDLKKKK